jgi:long-chain acyl-CoA synthetase
MQMAFQAVDPEPALVADSSKAPNPSVLPAFLRRVAQVNREFVIYDDGWRGWSYRYSDVDGMARALAGRLRAQGIHKGDRVIIWSEGRAGWIAALWGCLLEGVVLVPVDPQSSSSLFHRIEQKVQPRLILLGDLVPSLEGARQTPVWPLRDIETTSDQPPLAGVDLDCDDVAEIVFTSGTTAEPKGVVMTHRNLAASLGPLEEQVGPYRKYFRLLAPLRVLNLLPMSHLFGQAIAMFLVPLVPASVVFVANTSPEEIARQIRRRRMCALVSVPKVLEVLRDFVLHRFPETKEAAKVTGPGPVRWWRFRAVHRLFGWRFCCFIVGGAPLPPEIEQFWSNLGFVVAQGYGLTETAPIISFSHPFHVQRGTAGKPLAGVQLKIAEDGEVLVRGDNVTPGYFQLPSETAAAFHDGWFRTGDIGELGPGGDLVIRGRKKDVIVTPEGLKVFPEDVEAALNGIEGVRESAVVARDGVHAVLVLEPGFDSENVVRQANRQLEPHQRIRSISVWTHGELPRTSTTRKLRRAEINSALQSGRREATKPRVELSDLVQKYAPGRTITPDTTLEDLGLSSLDRVELMMDLEEKFETSIDESVFASISKVADLARPMAVAQPTPQPAYNRTRMARLIRRVLLPTVFLPLTEVFARLKVSGREHLETMHGPVIFVANHQSNLDTPAIMASLPRYWRYRLAPAMWKEYFDAHFFPDRHRIGERWGNSILYGLLTVLFNAFPIPQFETGTRQSLRYIGELVEEGWSILIFPEGERTLTGEIGVFYPGVAMIASRMRVPVVPIRLVGLDRILPRGTTRPRRGPVEIRIGAPMSLQGNSYTTLAKQVEDAVRIL